MEHSLSRGLLVSSNNRWTCADLPWRRLDEDGIEAPELDHDELVSNVTPFMQWGASLTHLTGYESQRVRRYGDSESWKEGMKGRNTTQTSHPCRCWNVIEVILILKCRLNMYNTIYSSKGNINGLSCCAPVFAPEIKLAARDSGIAVPVDARESDLCPTPRQRRRRRRAQRHQYTVFATNQTKTTPHSPHLNGF